jgi:hypothetical protein
LTKSLEGKGVRPFIYFKDFQAFYGIPREDMYAIQVSRYDYKWHFLIVLEKMRMEEASVVFAQKGLMKQFARDSITVIRNQMRDVIPIGQ